MKDIWCVKEPRVSKRRFPVSSARSPSWPATWIGLDSCSGASVPAHPGLLHDWGTKSPAELSPRAQQSSQPVSMGYGICPQLTGIPRVSPATTAGVIVQQVRAQPRPQPPESSALPQTRRHLLSSVKASAESFFLLRAEHLRTSCRRKKKCTGSFHTLSLLPKRDAWIHSPIQAPAVGETHCQPRGPCPGARGALGSQGLAARCCQPRAAAIPGHRARSLVPGLRAMPVSSDAL